jgi:endonuclease YncB( thermonuclease family)
MCAVTAFDRIYISEFLPDPSGDEVAGEWIELRSEHDRSVGLCGWSLDDIEGGSQPRKLDAWSIPARGFLALSRSETKLALNNPGDEVRLFPPGGGPPVQTVTYAKAPPGETYAYREDGHFVWTPYPTPGAENRFRTAERRFPGERVVVSAALPNPAGPDEAGEWIEISNVADEIVNLDGWQIDNKPGGSPPFLLTGIWLNSGQVRRFSILETGVTLVNSSDQVRLLDPDGYVASTFGWTEAVEGRVYRRPVLVTERANVRVLHVVDGDTIDIAFTDPDQLERLPESIKRRWLGKDNTGVRALRVRLIGIDTPETVHPSKPVQAYGKQASDAAKSLLQDADVELGFDEELWDKYDRLLAYVYLSSGETAQAVLLRGGLAYAYLRFPFAFREEFVAYEHEAQAARLGLWSDDEAALYALEQQEHVEAEAKIEVEGLGVSVDPKPGLVAPGTAVRFLPSVPASLFLSVNSGAFIGFSGSYVVASDVKLAVYAERTSGPPGPNESVRTGTGSVRSGVLTVSYALERDHYDLEAVISEVFPSPAPGNPEWIELQNPTDHDISLAGWRLDDVRDKGSKPYDIPPGFVIPAGGYLVFENEQTGLAFNNDGDEAWLISPDGESAVSLRFGKTKKGISVSLDSDAETCSSDVPTPGAPNVCVTFLPPNKAPDRDRDLLPDDREEWLYGSDPENPDTDGDGWLDGFETAVGEDPRTATGSLRPLRERYREFLTAKVKPSWTLYKRKGLVLRGKSYPLVSATALVAGVYEEAMLETDGSWEIILPPPLPAGVHPVDLRLTDTAGRTTMLPLRIELDEAYIVSPLRTAATRGSPLGKLKTKYRNVVIDEVAGSGAAVELPVSYRVLLALAATGDDQETPPLRHGTEIILLILALCAGILLHLRGWTLWKK